METDCHRLLYMCTDSKEKYLKKMYLFARFGRCDARRPDTVESILESAVDSKRVSNLRNKPEKMYKLRCTA